MIWVMLSMMSPLCVLKWFSKQEKTAFPSTIFIIYTHTDCENVMQGVDLEEESAWFSRMSVFFVVDMPFEALQVFI